MLFVGWILLIRCIMIRGCWRRRFGLLLLRGEGMSARWHSVEVDEPGLGKSTPRTDG